MGLGRFPPGLDEQIAAQAARMGNRSAHRFIMSEIYRQRPAADRVAWHRERLWRKRADILAGSKELAEEARRLTRLEKRALRMAAQEVLAPRPSAPDVPAFPAVHQVPPAMRQELQGYELDHSLGEPGQSVEWNYDTMVST